MIREWNLSAIWDSRGERLDLEVVKLIWSSSSSSSWWLLWGSIAGEEEKGLRGVLEREKK